MRNGPYTLATAPDGYPGRRYRGKYAYEHHIAYWTQYRKVPSGTEVVHHKNHDKRDNRPDNLELMSKSEHARHHCKATTWLTLMCAHCGVSFKRRKGRGSGKRDFCCRSHQVSTQQRERWARVRDGQ